MMLWLLAKRDLARLRSASARDADSAATADEGMPPLQPGQPPSSYRHPERSEGSTFISGAQTDPALRSG